MSKKGLNGDRNKAPQRGKGSGVENPGKILKRLAEYVLKYYRLHIIVVVVCILLSVVCNLQGTMFMQTLIDDYIIASALLVPLILSQPTLFYTQRIGSYSASCVLEMDSSMQNSCMPTYRGCSR